MAYTPTSNLFHIVICELCHPLIQGYVDHFSSSNISEHFMTLDRVEPSELFENIDNIPLSHINNLFITLKLRKRLFRRFIEHPCFRDHPSIRNYGKISNEITFSPQIAHCVELLPGQESVAILKTHWLRLIQRSWKRVFQERLKVTKLRSLYQNIKHRERTSKWPQKCNHMPSIKGMLSSLSKKKDLSLC